MTQLKFENQRDKLLRDYTLRARPAYDIYLNICRSKKCKCDYDGYKALQTDLKPKLDKMFRQIADLKSQVV